MISNPGIRTALAEAVKLRVSIIVAVLFFWRSLGIRPRSYIVPTGRR
jgi:hypothetical protein